MGGGRIAPGLVIAAVLAMLVPLVLTRLGYQLTGESTTYLLLGILAIAFLIERILWRKK